MQLSKIAFYGIGQVLLKRRSGAEQKYEVDITALGTLSVRSGFEKYGANAIFGENQKLLSIFVSHFNKSLTLRFSKMGFLFMIFKIAF